MDGSEATLVRDDEDVVGTMIEAYCASGRGVARSSADVQAAVGRKDATRRPAGLVAEQEQCCPCHVVWLRDAVERSAAGHHQHRPPPLVEPAPFATNVK